MDERNEIIDTTIVNNRFGHVRSRTISFTLLTSIIVTPARSTWMRSSLIPGCLSVCQGRMREGCDARLKRPFTIRTGDFNNLLSFDFSFINIDGVLWNLFSSRSRIKKKRTGKHSVAPSFGWKSKWKIRNMYGVYNSILTPFQLSFQRTAERFRKILLLYIHDMYILYMYVHIFLANVSGSATATRASPPRFRKRHAIRILIKIRRIKYVI